MMQDNDRLISWAVLALVLTVRALELPSVAQAFVTGLGVSWFGMQLVLPMLVGERAKDGTTALRVGAALVVAVLTAFVPAVTS